MYRLILESLLGVRLDVDRLHVAPCFPAHWAGVTIHYRHRETLYHIAVEQIPGGNGVCGGSVVTVDGIVQEGAWIPMVGDPLVHEVTVTVASPRGRWAVPGPCRT